MVDLLESGSSMMPLSTSGSDFLLHFENEEMYSENKSNLSEVSTGIQLNRCRFIWGAVSKFQI